MIRFTKIIIFSVLALLTACSPRTNVSSGNRDADRINNRASVKREQARRVREQKRQKKYDTDKAENRQIAKREKEITKELEKERKRRQKMQTKETQTRMKKYRKESYKNFKR